MRGDAEGLKVRESTGLTSTGCLAHMSQSFIQRACLLWPFGEMNSSSLTHAASCREASSMLPTLPRDDGACVHVCGGRERQQGLFSPENF